MDCLPHLVYLLYLNCSLYLFIDRTVYCMPGLSTDWTVYRIHRFLTVPGLFSIPGLFNVSGLFMVPRLFTLLVLDCLLYLDCLLCMDC